MVRQGLYHCATVLGRGNNLSGTSMTLILTIYSSIVKLGPITIFYLFLFFFYWKWSFFSPQNMFWLWFPLPLFLWDHNHILARKSQFKLSDNFKAFSKSLFFLRVFSSAVGDEDLAFCFCPIFWQMKQWISLHRFSHALHSCLPALSCPPTTPTAPLHTCVCVCDFTCMLKYETCV